VERAENLVNVTKSSIPEFERQSENARLRLSILTGQMPDAVSSMTTNLAPIPGADAQPVLFAPSDVIALRPDIRAASYNLSAATSLSEAATMDLFPTFNVSGFFGIAENALSSSSTIWSLAAGTALNLIDFGRIRGRIDAAKAIEMRAYEGYRRAELEAVIEVETALNDYAKINAQYSHLQDAYNNADKALQLSQLLYAEGEISFINVLEAQRTLNDVDLALVSSKSAQSLSLVRLYKSLGIY